MRKSLLILLSSLAIPFFAPAQEIPADLKAKIEAKSAEVNAGNSAAIKSWARKQISAWESIQSLSFAIDKEDLDAIKATAEKKFPLNYVEQEAFINEQANIMAGFSDYKVQLGKEAYNAAKERFEKTGNADLNVFLAELQKQVGAKNDLASLKPEGMDETTFAITKKVIEEKFPNDYASQLAAIKKQFNIATDAAKETASTSGGENADPFAAATETSGEGGGEAAAPDRPLTMGELNKKAKESFTQQAFIVEGKKKCSAITTEINGKQVILMPFTAYDSSGNITIMNNLGETVDFDPKEAYASVNVPVVLFFPKSMPGDVKPAKFPDEEGYKNFVNESVFFVGQSNLNVQSFPVKIVSISSPYLNLSTRVPTNFFEGTLLIDPRSDTTIGMLIDQIPPPQKIDWTRRSDVSKLHRTFFSSYNKGYMSCIRLDKFGNWEKVDLQKFDQQKEQLERLRAVLYDFMDFFLASNMVDLQNKPILGPTLKKHYKELKGKLEKQRFERLYRTFLQDLSQFIKSELRDINPKEFYSVYRNDARNYSIILQSILNMFENATKSNSFMDIVHNDIKRNISN